MTASALGLKKGTKTTSTKPVAKEKTKSAPKKKEDAKLGSIFDDLDGFKSQVKKGITDDQAKKVKAPYFLMFSNLALQMMSGGIIGGTAVEVSAKSAVGKSFIMLMLVADTQRQGGYALHFDGENAYEDAYARFCGVNLQDGSFVVDQETREISKVHARIVKFVEHVRETKKIKKVPILVTIDSFLTLRSANQTKADSTATQTTGYVAPEKNKEAGEMYAALSTYWKQRGVTLLLINQIKTKIIGASKFGNNDRVLAEETLGFYMTQRMKGSVTSNLVVKRKVNGKDISEIVGMKVKWEFFKNRGVKPFVPVTVEVMFNKGMDKYSGLVDLLMRVDRIAPATQSEKNKDPKKAPIIHKGYKVVADKDQIFYFNIQSLVEANPGVLEPLWIGSESVSDTLEVQEESLEETPEKENETNE